MAAFCKRTLELTPTAGVPVFELGLTPYHDVLIAEADARSKSGFSYSSSTSRTARTASAHQRGSSRATLKSTLRPGQGKSRR
jgi:hypothetical protein